MEQLGFLEHSRFYIFVTLYQCKLPMGSWTDSGHNFRTIVGDFLRFRRDADLSSEVIIITKISCHFHSDDNRHIYIYVYILLIMSMSEFLTVLWPS